MKNSFTNILNQLIRFTQSRMVESTPTIIWVQQHVDQVTLLMVLISQQ